MGGRPATYPLPVSTTARSAATGGSARSGWSATTTSCAWPASGATRSKRLQAPRHHHAGRAGQTPAGTPRCPGSPRDVRGAARAGRACSSAGSAPARSSDERSPPRPGAASRRCRRARRGDVIFDIEGDPFFEPARGLEYPVRRAPARRRRRAALPARSGRTTARESGGVRELHRLRPRAPRGSIPEHARLPLRRLRAERAQAADGPARHPRGRGRRPAPPAGPRRPLHGRPPGAARPQAQLLAQEGRGLLPASTRDGRGAVAAAGRSSTTSAGSTPATPSAARRDRALQRGGLPLHAGLLRLAASRRGPRRRCRGRRRRSAQPLPREAAEALRRAAAPARGARRRRRARVDARWLAGELLDYHRREAKPAWWWLLRAPRQMSPRSSSRTPRRSASSADRGHAARAGQALAASTRSAFPPQEHKLAARTSGRTIPRRASAPATILEHRRRRRGTARAQARPEASADGAAAARADPRRALRRPAAARRAARLGRVDAAPAMAATRRCAAILARERARASAGVAPGAQAPDHRPRRDAGARPRARRSYLFIQGPPGSGKTWTGARLIVAPARAGQRVGVAAPEPQGDPQPARRDRAASPARPASRFRGLKKSSRATTPSPSTTGDVHHERAATIATFAARRPDVQLIAGTAWLFVPRRDATGRSTTSSSTRPARSRWPTRSRWAPRRAT